MNKPSAKSVAAEIEPLRKKWGALVVLVVRGEDIAYSTEPGLLPRAVGEILRAETPAIVQGLADRFEARKGGAR